MKIIQESIKDLVHPSEPLLYLGYRLSQQGVVYFTVESFKFEVDDTNNQLDFSLTTLKSVYPNDKERIEGTIKRSSYEASREIIDLYVYCGALTFEPPSSKDDVPQDLRSQAESNLKTFWNEVEKNFTMPPTDVFLHEGVYGSIFEKWGYWSFCYIYLNSKTSEGIVLAGESSD